MFDSPAVIAAITGLIGGLITSTVVYLIAPSQQARRDAAKEKRAHRRELVVGWRTMVGELAKQGTRDGVWKELLGHEAFQSLAPHLAARGRAAVFDYTIEAADENSELPSPLSTIRDEIARIERKWDLV